MNRLIALGSALLLPLLAYAANPLVPGTLTAELPTVTSLGVYLPISGDDDRDASATLRYRAAGAAEWRASLPVLRVRPDQISGESAPGDYGLPVPAAQFAGSVTGLLPDTEYQLQLLVTDPDGGGVSPTLTLRTAAVPAAGPATPRVVNVTSASTLAAALAVALPGDVVTLAPGTYAGSFTLSRDGTAANPIVIRGASQAGAIIDAAGSTYGVTLSGDHTRLEALTVRGSTWGLRVNGTTGVVVRGVRLADVARGIDARGGQTRSLYLCDNVLEGRRVWPDFANAIENDEGIVLTGQGHTVCHNRIQGFGDALGLNQNTSLINAAMDIHGNDVLWTGDDGMELDYAYRNIRAYGNRITNASMGVSFQPVWGGPVYVFRNVFVNLARSPYKVNNDPTGFYIFNNTSVRTDGIGANADYAWPSLGYVQGDGDPAYAANFEFRNNLVIGVSRPAYVTTQLIDARIDGNGWWPDGQFTFFDRDWANLADLAASSPYEQNGRIVEQQPFAVPIVLGLDYVPLAAPPSPMLAAGSAAVDGGVPIGNVTDGFVGAAPDLGAWERGAPAPSYGPRSAADSDGDGVPDASDNCRLAANADQRDSNGDGYGNWCDGDLNDDGATNATDLALFRLTFGGGDPHADFNGNGAVNATDLARFRLLFGSPPGPGAGSTP